MYRTAIYPPVRKLMKGSGNYNYRYLFPHAVNSWKIFLNYDCLYCFSRQPIASWNDPGLSLVWHWGCILAKYDLTKCLYLPLGQTYCWYIQINLAVKKIALIPPLGDFASIPKFVIFKLVFCKLANGHFDLKTPRDLDIKWGNTSPNVYTCLTVLMF